MVWIKKRDMTSIHLIRQDYAQALNQFETSPTPEALDELVEQQQRRARAIRMLHEEDGTSVKHLSAMFRCSKTTIREALQEDS